MQNHVKPTQEELEAQEKAAIEEAERLATEPEVEEPEPSTPAPSEPAPEQQPQEEVKPSTDELKQKLSASARENQRIYAKNRVINQALAQADDIDEPTETDLKGEYRDWDTMSDLEKTFAKEMLVSKRWRATIAQAKEQAEKIEKWNESITKFVDDPKTYNAYPDLEGKSDDFKEFAAQEENNSVPMKILVSAFLHEQSSGKTPNKGRMFESGSGGPNERPQPKSDKLTLDQARKLRDTDYTKWREYLMAGKIENDL